MKISKLKLISLVALSLFFWNSNLGFLGANISASAANKDAIMMITPDTQTVRPGQTFETKVIIDNNASKQGIITAGFDLEYPANLLEVVDSDSSAPGTQIKSEGNDFSLNDSSLNSVSSGKISFTTGTQGSTPITKNEILVGTINFKAKTGISTQIATLKFTTNSPNNGAFINGNNNTPESILKDGVDGLKSGSIVISNIGISLSPATKQVKSGDNFSVDIVLSNPDQKNIVTVAFEIIYDKERIKSKNTEDKILITVDDSKNMQTVENTIKTASGSIVFTGGFTGNKMKDKTLTIGTLNFEALKDGTANIRTNQNINASSVYLENDAANNYLANFTDGKYTIGTGTSSDGPTSEANPRGGSFTTEQLVELTTDDSKADIYYTTNGDNPTKSSAKYKTKIAVNKTTTLKFFAVDEDGNEEDINTEIYQIGSGDAFAIGITSVKNELSPGEQTSLIIKVIDSSINKSAPNKVIKISNSGEGTLEASGGLTTDEEGEILVNYTASTKVGTDVITAKLADNPDIQGHLNLEIKSSDISKVTLVGSTLSTARTNLISATVENSAGQKTSAVLPVELKITKKGTSESKTYSTEISSGIATFGVPGTDLQNDSTYILVASVNGISSNTLELSTASTNGTGGNGGTGGGTGRLRPGGGQPGTGPKENLIVLLIISTVGVYFYQKRKNKLA